ncbi:hypothetical protein K7X08_021319 [Anisodus acutangulus]|uniref:Late blight resistance protein R1A-like N-terminal domain-containing protein n=1 Tax=Anisodus acutangulus TaxID=402998 RepID=A0A9Q1M0D0_9SOLA|nr:hypothetical protein K7X08_021319 [Anisodus acutangulus]
MISKVLKTIRLEYIAELINVSKPSRSSSPITMEKVGSVVALLVGVTFILCLLDVKRYDVLVSMVKEKLRYLELFFTLTAKWCIELKRMKGLITYADDVAYTTMHLCFFVAAYKMEEDGHKALVLDIEFCDFLHKLSPFSHELRQIYPSLLIGSKSSGTEPTMDAKFMSNCVDALKKDLEERLSRDAILKTAFDDRIPWLRQGLSYLSRFLSEIVSKCTPLEELNSLQSHTEALAIEATIVIYTFCDARMDMKSTDIDHKHFLVQLKFNRVMVEIDLIQLLKAESAICLIYEEAVDSNKSRKVNLVLQFLTITFKLIKFVESLMVLLKDTATLKAEILDLIESAHEELIFLRAFVMDVLTQHTELNELHDLLMRAEVTAHKLGQISDSCYGSFVDGSSTQQMRLSLSDLLQEIESVKFRLPWNQFSTIEELHILEILKLLLRAFEGYEWEVKDSEFPELKYLELDDLNIAQWSVYDDAFPKLERLVLTKCKWLEKIPYHFDDAVCLQSTEVNWCSWSVANSGQEIQKTQRDDMANNAFAV